MRRPRNNVPAPQWREPTDIRPDCGPPEPFTLVAQPADVWLVGTQVEAAFADLKISF